MVVFFFSFKATMSNVKLAYLFKLVSQEDQISFSCLSLL